MIPVEPFIFAIDVKDEYAHIDLDYVIGVGANRFNSCISEWSNNTSCIRKQLEQYVEKGESRIEICFEDSPTIIFMKRTIIKDSEILVHIRIEPNEFLKDQLPISGYCNEQQVIQTLYAGLLFGMKTRMDDRGWGYDWNACKMVNYNRMKSIIVESYLIHANVVPPFRNAIKHILVYTGHDFIRICDESDGYHTSIGDKMVIVGKDNRVLCQLSGIKTELEYDKVSALEHLAQTLPSDFDLWDISGQALDFLVPVLFFKKEVKDTGCHFSDDDVDITEYGCDPYGFTSKNLLHACNNRDMTLIRSLVEVGADLSRAISWVLYANAPGSGPFHSLPEPSEEEFLLWDKEKVEIVSYLLDCGANPSGDEDHQSKNLKYCIWYYCPECMDLLLQRGADPNAQDTEMDRVGEVAFRSVLSLLNCKLERGDHVDILLRMKASLEAYEARDFVIYNEKKQR